MHGVHEFCVAAKRCPFNIIGDIAREIVNNPSEAWFPRDGHLQPQLQQQR